MEILTAGLPSPHILRKFGIIALLMGSILTRAVGQIDEYQAKAAFLFNFAKFVEWPTTPQRSEKGAIRICVLGRNPFGSSLENVVYGKDIGGRQLSIVQVTDLSQAATCHIIFVGASECKRFKTMVADLAAANVLTVGESDVFASLGGIVNFKIEDGRIRFDINLGAAEQAKLRISSKLLSLARTVK